MINETLKKQIEWIDTDMTMAKDIIPNYEAWINYNYNDRIKQVNKDIFLDGKSFNLALECGIIAENIFNECRIKNKSKIKLCIKALAEKNAEIIKNTDDNGNNISDKYLEEFNEIQGNIDKGNDFLSDLLNIVEKIPDNDWDIYKKWKADECLYLRDKEGNIIGVDCCYANLIGWLDHFPLTKNKITYDKVKLEVSWNGKVIKDNDTHKLMQLFNKYLCINFSNLRSFHDALVGYAIKKQTNPVKDYFDNLSKWDGVDYIEKAIREVLNCEDIDKYYKLYYEELKMHGIAFLRRMYNKELYEVPTKYDQILTFTSQTQGSGKTTFFERLYNFDNNIGYCYVVAGCDFKPHDKDFVIQAHKNCCMCLDEVDMKRGLVNTIKGFISRQNDEFRLPYGIDSMKPVRGFVITATSNNTDFLKDYTTKFERRWHIIHIAENPTNNRKINEAFDNGFRNKFWSQIKHLYNSEPKYETWIEDGSELGLLLSELQQGYKFYYTDDDYIMLDNILEKEYCQYAYTNTTLSADDIVEQFKYIGDITEWVTIKNEAIDKKQKQDNYIPNPITDRKFSSSPDKLEWIPVQTLNEVLKKLGLNCTPQGIKNHLVSKWKCGNKRYNGNQYWSWIKL